MGQILNAIEEFVGPVGLLAAVFAAIAAIIFMARHESKRRSLNRKKLMKEDKCDMMKAKKEGTEMMRTTCEDIGRWMVQNHPEIADAPKEIKGTGFYITPMIYGNKTFVVIFASDGTWKGCSSGELAKAFGSYGGFRRRFRDRRIARMMRRCLKKEQRSQNDGSI